MTASRRTPGELPFDGRSLPRDHGPCDACGVVELLAPGSTLCTWCEELGRAAAEAAVRARARAAGGSR